MMDLAVSRSAAQSAALTRLSALAPLDPATIDTLRHAIAQAVPVRNRTELTSEGREILEPRLIVEGWAARVRIMIDGRRQFLSFLLPGDLVGVCHQARPVAVSTIVALTDLLVAAPPPALLSPDLAEVYAISAALEEAHLLAHISRLGRLHAQERIADLLLELNERLTLNGMATNGEFNIPLTQEMLGDALGLTSVHINRMLQLTRREGDLIWREGRVTLRDPAGLADAVGRVPVRVTNARP